jgi:hypothetical protein
MMVLRKIAVVNWSGGTGRFAPGFSMLPLDHKAVLKT